MHELSLNVKIALVNGDWSKILLPLFVFDNVNYLLQNSLFMLYEYCAGGDLRGTLDRRMRRTNRVCGHSHLSEDAQICVKRGD